ncbi:hypothetical protein A2U01_0084428, partial [Trifolium medium]|nr:hypothetical protein [Trifolium medium]
LMEVVWCKESPMLQLVEPPKIPWLVGSKQFFKSTEGILGVEEGVMGLIGLS